MASEFSPRLPLSASAGRCPQFLEMKMTTRRAIFGKVGQGNVGWAADLERARATCHSTIDHGRRSGHGRWEKLEFQDVEGVWEGNT